MHPPPEIHIQKTTQLKTETPFRKKIQKTADDDQADFARNKMRENQNPNLILREHPHDKQTKTHMHRLTS